MMLTREQAAATWCPMVRIARHEVVTHREPVGSSGMELVRQQDHVVAGCNTDALGSTRVPASCRCITDQCAMWRWGYCAPDPLDPAPPPVGYCGLAGRPA